METAVGGTGLISVKQIGIGDAQVTYGSGERPRYRALANSIDAYYQDILRPLADLRETVFMVLPLEDVGGKSAYDLLIPDLQQRVDRLIEDRSHPDGRSYPESAREPLAELLLSSPRMRKDEESFRYLARHKRVIDDAIDLFLNEMAGPDRSREGFVEGGIESDTPDGVMQQRSVFTHAVGVQRAAQVVGVDSTVTSGRQSPAVKAMLDNAFTRLSEGGRLRLEGVRDEIHSVLVSGTDAGLGPIEVGRQLSKQFNQYERFEFERLARTEAAFAAEAGTREQYREFGVQFVRWVISSGACQLCVAFEGQLVPIEETENQPPIHPNCLCSTIPVGLDEP